MAEEKVIMICSLKDKRLANAVLEHLMTFHMAKDMHLELSSYSQCEEMEAAEKLPPKRSYWWPSKEGWALTIDAEAKTYSRTWTQMTTCYSDFCAGWRAANA